MNLMQTKSKISGALGLGLVAIGGLVAALGGRAEPPETKAIPGFDLIAKKARTNAALAASEKDYEARQAAANRRILAQLPMLTRVQPRLIKRWKASQMVFRMQFSPDGKWLALAGDVSGSVVLYPTRNWQQQASIRGGAEFAWAPNSRFLAVAARGVEVWDVTQNRFLCTLDDNTGQDGSGQQTRPGAWGPLLFSADSSKVATLGEDPNSTWKLNGWGTDADAVHEIAVKIWDANNGNRLKTRPGPASNGDNNLFRLSNDPKRVEFAGIIELQNAVSTTRPPIYAFTPTRHRSTLFTSRRKPEGSFATVSAGDGLLAIAGNGWLYATMNSRYPQNIVRIFRTRDQNLLSSLSLTQSVRWMALSPDAETLAIAQDEPVKDESADGIRNSYISIYQLAPSTD